ncbi:MAG TPA: hypothetical protein VJ919_16810, partial [Tangfeifania sp.]|nr:hypothetical protein [Tangfeifania sp.]
KNLINFREQKTKNLQKAIECYQNGLKALNFDISELPDSAPDAAQSLSMALTMEFINLIGDVMLIFLMCTTI